MFPKKDTESDISIKEKCPTSFTVTESNNEFVKNIYGEDARVVGEYKALCL
jgi:hypothetical protein